MRPVLYPSAILVAFVLNFMVQTAVSPYAAGRPLVAAVAIGLGVTWLAGLLTGDRDVAGLMAAIVALLLLVASVPAPAVLCVVALALLVAQRLLARRRNGSGAGDRLWPTVTRILTAGALILLVAVGIKAVQMDRILTAVHDLAAEFPTRAVTAVAASRADLPNMYFILLDGYPRADKLESEFGIDASRFMGSLAERGFFVAAHSRSNYTSTHLTLAQMFNHVDRVDIDGGTLGGRRPWRHYVNEGPILDDLRGLGYELIAVSPAYEEDALRQADRFIDTGQLNEFEWILVQMTGFRVVADALYPGLLTDQHRERVREAFEVTADIAREASPRRRFVFTHIMSPHSPQVFAADGGVIDPPGFGLLDDDREEADRLGMDEYVRRLGGQVSFINSKVLELVDEVVAADPNAVVVVFSDHGSKLSGPEDGYRGADLRTANLLAVRSPGRADIVGDRSTLANLIPRLMRAYAGTGPADVSETIYAWAEVPGMSFVFDRPD
jgi:hypothetical protein